MQCTPRADPKRTDFRSIALVGAPNVAENATDGALPFAFCAGRWHRRPEGFGPRDRIATMAAPLRVEQRLSALEERMTALERLPERMDRFESEMVQLRAEMRAGFAAADDRLSVRIEDSRRETRVLHEDVIARIALLGEGLVANNQALASEMRAMFETVNSRLAALENQLPVPRRRKTTG